MSRSLYIIAYDIHCSSTRQQIATQLQTWRTGGQYSVAECWLSPIEFTYLWQTLLGMFNPQTDHLLALSQDQRSHSQTIGCGQIYAGQPFIVG